MTVEELIRTIRQAPQSIVFADVMETITANYDYTPTAFTNGEGDARIINRAGENEGSCKVFAFGKMKGLSEPETLACFGEHYRDVLKTPDGSDHANIRTFMHFGWSGIALEGSPLAPRGDVRDT